MGEITEAVRRHYAAAATTASETGSCCGGVDCGCTCGEVLEGTDIDLAMPLSLGCGLPVGLARLQPGETVLDLGSGAGLDVLVASRTVGERGHVYGVDMTDEMLKLAQANRERAGATNVSFLKGRIEDVPLPAESVDVVISNCVINLSEDKAAVLKDAFRVLRPGGRLAVADMVAVDKMPAVELEAWASCIAGAIPADRYRELLSAAGFVDVSIESAGSGTPVVSANVTARKPGN
jgi:arsenite methyltransferase